MFLSTKLPLDFKNQRISDVSETTMFNQLLVGVHLRWGSHVVWHLDNDTSQSSHVWFPILQYVVLSDHCWCKWQFWEHLNILLWISTKKSIIVRLKAEKTHPKSSLWTVRDHYIANPNNHMHYVLHCYKQITQTYNTFAWPSLIPPIWVI